MTRNGAVLDVRGTIEDGHRVSDLPSRRFLAQPAASSPHGAACTKARHQLLLQHPTGLYEEAVIDRLMRHLHALSIRVRLNRPG